MWLDIAQRKLSGAFEDLCTLLCVPKKHRVLELAHHVTTQVSDFKPYLLNEQNRQSPNFDLKTDGYDSRLGDVGWRYRRQKAEFEREQQRLLEEAYGSRPAPQSPEVAAESLGENEFAFVPLPSAPPTLAAAQTGAASSVAAEAPAMPQAEDPFKGVREREHTQIFDPAKQQHPGIILGLALANRKFRDSETGEVQDVYINVPGDDIQITLIVRHDTP